MKTFIQYLLEINVDHLKRHLVPAYHINGQHYIGKKGEGHVDIVDRHPEIAKMEKEKKLTGLHRGFYHPPTKTFHPSSEIHPHLDSTELMTDRQLTSWADRQIAQIRK